MYNEIETSSFFYYLMLHIWFFDCVWYNIIDDLFWDWIEPNRTRDVFSCNDSSFYYYQLAMKAWKPV